MSTSSDFVNVPVPASRVPEVYALLAAPPAPAPAAAPAAQAVMNGGAVWTPKGDPSDEDVHPWTVSTLRRMYNDSTGHMRDALDFLADHAGSEVTTNQLAKELSLPKGAASVAGMVGAFARRCWNRYDRYLPWDSWWQPLDDGERTETVFVMPEAIGEVLRTFREE